MANDRLYLTCTKCGGSHMLYRYYPSGGAADENVVEPIPMLRHRTHEGWRNLLTHHALLGMTRGTATTVLYWLLSPSFSISTSAQLGPRAASRSAPTRQ